MNTEQLHADIKRILDDPKMSSSDKLRDLSLYVPICQKMQVMKQQGHFWKPLLEDVCVFLINENFELRNHLLTHNQVCASVRVPMMGVVR